MKNAFLRYGRTCVSLLGTSLIAGGLMAAAAFAAEVNRVTVNLPHAVTVGSVTLPSGQYTISGLDMSDGEEYFVVRGEHTPVVTLQAQRIEASDASKTQVVFTQDGSTWHFDKLFLAANGVGYQFANSK